MRARGLAVAALVLSATALAAAADRGRLGYRIAPGDTLPLVAAEFYGDRDGAAILAVANHLEVTARLRVGAPLAVPVPVEVVTAPGDTIAGLAAAHLDDARRAPALARWNQLAEGASLAAGTVVRIAPVIAVSVATASTYPEVVARWAPFCRLGGGRARVQLRHRRRHRRRRGGAVPLTGLNVPASKLPARADEAVARITRQHAAIEAAQAALPVSRAAWRAGDYAAVKRELAPLDRPFLPHAPAVEAGILLASAYVALGDLDSALAIFSAVRQRAPRLRLSPYHHPPSVCAAWTRAGGALAEAP
ncbi:MAG: hypothetical protein R2939_19395 [Kofleriaceae bacterium]